MTRDEAKHVLACYIEATWEKDNTHWEYYERNIIERNLNEVLCGYWTVELDFDWVLTKNATKGSKFLVKEDDSKSPNVGHRLIPGPKVRS